MRRRWVAIGLAAVVLLLHGVGMLLGYQATRLASLREIIGPFSVLGRAERDDESSRYFGCSCPVHVHESNESSRPTPSLFPICGSVGYRWNGAVQLQSRRRWRAGHFDRMLDTTSLCSLGLALASNVDSGKCSACDTALDCATKVDAARVIGPAYTTLCRNWPATDVWQSTPGELRSEQPRPQPASLLMQRDNLEPLDVLEQRSFEAVAAGRQCRAAMPLHIGVPDAWLSEIRAGLTQVLWTGGGGERVDVAPLCERERIASTDAAENQSEARRRGPCAPQFELDEVPVTVDGLAGVHSLYTPEVSSPSWSANDGLRLRALLGLTSLVRRSLGVDDSSRYCLSTVFESAMTANVLLHHPTVEADTLPGQRFMDVDCAHATALRAPSSDYYVDFLTPAMKWDPSVAAASRGAVRAAERCARHLLGEEGKAKSRGRSASRPLASTVAAMVLARILSFSSPADVKRAPAAVVVVILAGSEEGLMFAHGVSQLSSIDVRKIVVLVPKAAKARANPCGAPYLETEQHSGANSPPRPETVYCDDVLQCMVHVPRRGSRVDDEALRLLPEAVFIAFVTKQDVADLTSATATRALVETFPVHRRAFFISDGGVTRRFARSVGLPLDDQPQNNVTSTLLPCGIVLT